MILDGYARVNGLFSKPVYGLASGMLNENVTPRALLLSLERLDIGLPLEADLETKVVGLDAVSPGQTISCMIELRNNGLKPAANMSVIAIFPPHNDFVSASGDYSYYDIAHWINNKYAPVPFVRWDFAQIMPKTSIDLNYQSRIRFGIARQILKGEVYIIPREKADEIFAPYGLMGVP